MTATTCPARIRPFPGTPIIDCEREVHGDDRHQGALRDYAYPASTTEVVWYQADRRTFTGDWIECPRRGCVLPANHRGDHAL